jgi:hypothetical protein
MKKTEIFGTFSEIKDMSATVWINCLVDLSLYSTFISVSLLHAHMKGMEAGKTEDFQQTKRDLT